MILIRKTKIINAHGYLRGFKPGENLRVIHPLDDGASTDLMRVGFPLRAEVGDTLLPAIVGPTSEFNAEGRWIVRKDLPKEPRYTHTIEWTWEQWAGRYRTETPY